MEYHHLISKVKTKSPVWTTFGLPANEHGVVLNDNLAVCKLCQKSVSAKGGSTTNLLSHLKVHHPLKYAEITSKRGVFPTAPAPLPFIVNNPDDPPVASTSSESLAPPFKVQRTMMDYQPLDKNTEKRCTEAVTEWLATTMQSYNIVEHEKFVNMLKVINPRYKLPGRKHFSQEAVPKLYNETVSKIKSIISKVSETELSITTDCWTSVANSPYISITVHFVSPEWTLINACLNCKHFDENHNADNIEQVLTDTMSEWEIDIKNIACCVTNNGPNIVKAIEQLKVPHLTCFAHYINLGVNKALEVKQVKNAIVRLKSLQSSISHSWKMRRDLNKAQEFLSMEQISLPSACPTRWWSTTKLCKRYLKMQLAVCKMLMEYHPSKKHLMLEVNEVAAIEEFVSATELLEEITTTLGGSNYLTASSVLPLYSTIKKHLTHTDKDSELMKNIKTEILKPLKQRYDPEVPMASQLGISTLCDPRFRLRFLETPNDIKKITVNKMANISRSSATLLPQSVTVQKKREKRTGKIFRF